MLLRIYGIVYGMECCRTVSYNYNMHILSLNVIQTRHLLMQKQLIDTIIWLAVKVSMHSLRLYTDNQKAKSLNFTYKI